MQLQLSKHFSSIEMKCKFFLSSIHFCQTVIKIRQHSAFCTWSTGFWWVKPGWHLRNFFQLVLLLSILYINHCLHTLADVSNKFSWALWSSVYEHWTVLFNMSKLVAATQWTVTAEHLMPDSGGGLCDVPPPACQILTACVHPFKNQWSDWPCDIFGLSQCVPS